MHLHPHPLLVGALSGLLAVTATAQTVTRVSTAANGTEGNGQSWYPAFSGDGRFVSFESASSNLVPGDTNGVRDIFVKDRQTGVTERVSVGNGNLQGNNASLLNSALSHDGRFVVFESLADNLVAGDTNGAGDIFQRDRLLGTTTRVSVTGNGLQCQNVAAAPAMSANGRFVAFHTASVNFPGTSFSRQVYVRDTVANTLVLASCDANGVPGSNDSLGASLSADGRYVAFESSANNLVPGDTNGAQDVFVKDLQTGAITRASVATGGAQGSNFAPNTQASLSADGHRVAFLSNASNLVAGDTNGTVDIFVRDLVLGTTVRASVGAAGIESNSLSSMPAMSANGRYVAMWSMASNLVPNGTNNTDDVFVRDLVGGVTTRVSVTAQGAQVHGGNQTPAISADGRLIGFPSSATTLVANDTNGVDDVFVRDQICADGWCDLGSALAGTHGLPVETAQGALAANGATAFDLTQCAGNTVGVRVFGLTAVQQPTLGGVLVPSPDLLLAFVTGASGDAQLSLAWPAGVPSGTQIFVQAWLIDAAAVQGFAASNALVGTAP